MFLKKELAEASITLPNSEGVIDFATERIRRGNELIKQRISAASRLQRRGRCGRECEGLCLILLPADDAKCLRPFREPEIKRLSASSVLLRLLAEGYLNNTKNADNIF